MRHVGNEGLKTIYITGKPPEVKTWIMTIMGMMQLPAFLIPIFWKTLGVSPAVENEALSLSEALREVSSKYVRVF